MNGIIATWRDALHQVLDIYEQKRGAIQVFFPLLFSSSSERRLLLWGHLHGFSHYMQTHEASHYAKLNPRGHFRSPFRQSFLLRHDLDHSRARIRTSEYVFHLLPGPCHRHSGI